MWNHPGGFSGAPVPKTPGSQFRGPGSIPGQESRATRPPNAETKNDPACLDQERWRVPQLDTLRAATRIHVLQLRTGAAK